ncbi:hypothetical protein TKK_0000551 [Trichogramma kaykai]|uniref:Uncharacterized protein n=1 Tax=Trichogramma kaykai TaxID=54128 RepID=A0ABD2VZ82_9HYME
MYAYVLAASRRVNSRICVTTNDNDDSRNNEDQRVNDKMAGTRIMRKSSSAEEEKDFNRTGLRVDYDKVSSISTSMFTRLPVNR